MGGGGCPHSSGGRRPPGADYEPDFAVPCDSALVGLPWAAQGTVVGGRRIDLTTARCGVVGSVDFVADP